MKQKSLFSIKDVVAIGVGAALFVVIAMLQIPAPAPNTSIQLQYALQALFSVVFGPIVGFLMGLIAPVGDVLIYKESANKVFLQGVVAGSFNALTVAVAGSLLLIAYARTQTKDGSLTKD